MKVLTDDEIKTNIATNIRRLLDLRGWKQCDLARESGLPEMTVSAVVRQINLAGIGTASRLAEALDVTVDRLISNPPKKNQTRDT